jgi:hypothetical protein
MSKRCGWFQCATDTCEGQSHRSNRGAHILATDGDEMNARLAQNAGRAFEVDIALIGLDLWSDGNSPVS